MELGLNIKALVASLFVLTNVVLSVNAPVNAAEEVSVNVNTVKQELKDIIFKKKAYFANFNQVITNNDKKILQELEGELRLLRPNYMSMKVTSPDETELLSDGKDIYSFDAMLEQVTIYSYDDSNFSSPIMLLVSEKEQIWNKYNFVKLSKDELEKEKLDSNSMVYSVNTKDNSGLINSMKLYFTNDLISKVQIVEKDGKTNTYSFKNINTNEVKMVDFKFDIPEGVTVDDQRVK
jgi:outer membrane lipoprotein carrier protein